MDSKKIDTIANNIVKELKSGIKCRKGMLKDYPYADQSVYLENDQIYDNKKGKYLWYIKCGKKKCVEGIENLYDIEQINRAVILKLNELKKTGRTYKNLQLKTGKMSEGNGWYNMRSYTLLESVLLPENPCKEFKSFQNYMKKYGHFTIPDFALYSCHGGGKRGYLYGEEGDRYFLDNKPKKCARVLEEIRKARGSKDIMTCRLGKEEYIDPIDRQYSQMHEVECDGEYRNYVQVVIKTPTGKVKYDQKIY